jgi:hypothetical protein
MIRQLIYMVAVVSILASCTRINFIYTISDNKEEKIFKKEILGKWGASSDEGKELITIDSTINPESGITYKITIFENSEELKFGDLSYFTGQLFDVQGNYFMMIQTDYEHEKLNGVGRYNIATIIPTYYVIRIFSINDHTMEAGILDGEIFMKLVKERKISIRHEVIEADDDGEPADVIVFEKPDALKKILIEG